MQPLDNLKSGKWFRLSHILTPTTPAYGGGGGLKVQVERSIDQGDSCNQVHLSLSNHLGSHVDAPQHFLKDGMTVDDYDIKDWFFYKPYLIDIAAKEEQLIGIAQFELVLKGCQDADILLVRTGFEAFRNEKKYWAHSPAIKPDVSVYLTKRLPSLKAIGVDTISLTSYQHRDLGRQAHRSFFGVGLRIFEDLAMAEVPAGLLKLVISFPLLFDNADGAPCTMAALV